MAKSYENLKIWQDSVNLASLIYEKTKKFPEDELFGIISQLRRAVISISSNIAEGAGRNSKKEFCRFINISIGSLNETESLWIISLNLKYISKEECLEILTKIKNLGNLLGAFRKYLLK